MRDEEGKAAVTLGIDEVGLEEEAVVVEFRRKSEGKSFPGSIVDEECEGLARNRCR